MEGEIAVLDPGGLVEYQDGAVVSRQLLKTPGGSITVFAFAAGEGLSEHTTPHDAFVQVLCGSARIEVAGKGHRVKAGLMIRLPAGVPHAVHADENFKMLLVMIRSAGP